MLAVVRHGLGKEQMDLQDIPMPECGPDEALVRVKAVGVCGSDFAMWKGKVATAIPVVVGHEIAGVVEAVGSNVASAKPGTG